LVVSPLYGRRRRRGKKWLYAMRGPSCITLGWTDGTVRAATTLEHHTGFMALLQKVDVSSGIQEG
jgi:hypothetical protein